MFRKNDVYVVLNFVLGSGFLTQASILPKYDQTTNGKAFHLSNFNAPRYQRLSVQTAGNFEASDVADCRTIQNAGYRTNGIYATRLNGTVKEIACYFDKIKAYTIIQQRIRGDTDFNQSLINYVHGFGAVNSDHWIGLNTIRHLVEIGNTQLQVVMTAWPPINQTITANYGSFSIGTAMHGWPLFVGNYSGPIPDNLNYGNGRPFYAPDNPDHNNCALDQRGGWWFNGGQNDCSYAYLNGYYYYGGSYAPPSHYYDGIYWKDWLGYDYSLMSVTMAVTHA